MLQTCLARLAAAGKLELFVQAWCVIFSVATAGARPCMSVLKQWNTIAGRFLTKVTCLTCMAGNDRCAFSMMISFQI
jgi:hypothetical protein